MYIVAETKHIYIYIYTQYYVLHEIHYRRTHAHIIYYVLCIIETETQRKSVKIENAHRLTPRAVHPKTITRR